MRRTLLHSSRGMAPRYDKEMKYRTKEQQVDAIEFTGRNLTAIARFVTGEPDIFPAADTVEVLATKLGVKKGDMVVRDSRGVFRSMPIAQFTEEYVALGPEFEATTDSSSPDRSDSNPAGSEEYND